MTSDQFKNFLKRMGISAYRFSQETGIPKSTVYDWLNRGVPKQSSRLMLQMMENKNS